MSVRPPLPNTYWVAPGRLLAGEYPGDWDHGVAIDKLRTLLTAGVDQFMDLTHPRDGMKPYAETALAEGVSQGINVVYGRHPIVDRWVPTSRQMAHILDAIDSGLARGKTVYVHCWGGVGRTGTVVGCWLVRNREISGADALRQIAQWWRGVEKSSYYARSPETGRQQRLVSDWAEPNRTGHS